MMRRFLLLPCMLSGSLTGLPAQSANAQSYPSRAITIVVTVSAGGVADLVARLVANRL